MATADLPKSDSPDIHLVVATPEENLVQLHANSVEWQGALSLEAYLRREDHLANQELTKDGGLTAWMLVYHPPDGDRRRVLCGCESILKKALVAKNGNVDDVRAQGVASVFCPPQHRGRGYPRRMMTEMAKRLKYWQAENGRHNAFSVLFSDIGKAFYAVHGWQPFPSTHINLKPTARGQPDVPGLRILQEADLPALCERDESNLRKQLGSITRGHGRTSVALTPDFRTLEWHFARQSFVSNELYHRSPSDRGALVGGGSGPTAWCYWTRVWANPQEDAPNTMHILRIAVEDTHLSDLSPATEAGVSKLADSPATCAVASLLAEARSRASEWDMEEVQIWNPTSLTLAAARLLEAGAAVITREKESITCLLWYGEGSWEEVDWVCNEKYGWN